MNTNKEKDRRKPYSWTIFLIGLSIAITIIISVILGGFYHAGFAEEMETETYDKYYMMITEDNASSIWTSIYEGAKQHAIEENAYVDWLGEDLLTGYSVEEMMQIAIASDVDGIIVTANEDARMMELINEAAAADIPVVTLYGDSPNSRRCSFVGVGSYNLGREYGRQALQIIKEKMQENNGGKSDSMEEEQPAIGADDRPARITVLVNAYAQDLDQNILCSGIQETIEQEKKENTQVELSLLPVDDTNAFSVEESIRDIFMEQEIPDIIICLNELNTTCVYQAVVDYNRVGEVSILGYYDSDTIINAIDRNVIYATVSIDTRQMGEFCIDALREYYELGYTSQYFTADITLIDKNNVDQYLLKEEETDEDS